MGLFNKTRTIDNLVNEVAKRSGTDAIESTKQELIKCQNMDDVLKSDVFKRALSIWIRDRLSSKKTEGDNRIIDIFSDKEYREKYLIPKAFSTDEDTWDKRGEIQYNDINTHIDHTAIVFLKESLLRGHQIGREGSAPNNFAEKILKLAGVDINQQGRSGIFQHDYKRISDTILEELEKIEEKRGAYWKKKRLEKENTIEKQTNPNEQ